MSTNVHDTEQQFHPALLDLAALQSSGTWSPTDAPSAAGLQTRQRQYQDAHFYRSRPGARASERPSHSRTRSTPKQQSHLNKKPLEHSNGRLSWSGVPAANFVDSSHPELQFLRSSAPASSHNGQDEAVPAGHAASDVVLLNAAEELEKLARSFRHEVAERKRARMAQLPGSKLTRQREQNDKTSDPRRRSDVHKAAKSSVLAGYDCVVEPAQRIMSPLVSLDGLYAKFLEVYLPRNPKGDTATAVLSFLIVTPTVLPSPVIALEEAIRTLVLVSLGGATGNDVLLQQAVTHYGRALSSLRRSIARPQLEDYEHTFVAIMILLMCSHHNKIRTVDNGWVQHMWGAQHYFVARNSGSFQTKAGALALALARHASLSYSLLARKASIFAKSMANGFAPRDNKTRPNWSDLLFPTSLQIPTLLERLDALALSHQIDPDSIEALDKACSGVELRLRTWFREWTAVHTTIGIALFKEQRVERFSTFSKLCRDRTFQYAYRFEDFSYAFLAVWYCVSMHYVVQTRISLEALRHGQADDAASKIDWSTYHSEGDSLVRDICMCIPFLCEDQCGMSGYIAMMLPLRVATARFQKQKSKDYLRWTDEVRKTVFVKGISPPNASYQRRTS